MRSVTVEANIKKTAIERETSQMIKKICCYAQCATAFKLLQALFAICVFRLCQSYRALLAYEVKIARSSRVIFISLSKILLQLYYVSILLIF